MKRILLVGRSGNGLRSTVESINLESQNENWNFSQISAVECRGVGDTGDDRQESEKTVVNNVRSELKRCEREQGFVVIGLVLKYGVRFTKQEKDAVQEVRLMFGRNVFRDHVIIIMTRGDLFELDDEESDRTFKDWCLQQTGDLKLLFQELNYRVILFDNKTKDSSKCKRQIDDLKKCLSEIEKSYRLSDFEEAHLERETRTKHNEGFGEKDLLVPVQSRNAILSVLLKYRCLIACILVFFLALFLLIYFLV